MSVLSYDKVNANSAASLRPVCGAGEAYIKFPLQQELDATLCSVTGPKRRWVNMRPQVARFCDGQSAGRLRIVSALLAVMLGWQAAAVSAAPQVPLREKSQADELVKPTSDVSFGDVTTQRVLMLHNGSTFQGIVEKQQAKWRVKVDAQTTVHFENYQVALVADSMNDIYYFRSQRISSGDIAGHANLVRWCLKHELFEQAKSELIWLREVKAAPKLIESLQRQFQSSLSPLGVSSMGVPGPGQPTSQLANAGPLVPQTSGFPARQNLGQQASINGVLFPNKPVDGLSPLPLGAANGFQPNKVGVLSTIPSIEGAEIQTNSQRQAAHLRDDPTSGVLPVANAADARFSLAQSELTASPSSKALVNSVFSFYDRAGFKNDPSVQQQINTSLNQSVVDGFAKSIHGVVLQACAGCHYPDNERLKLASGFHLDIPSSPEKATVSQLRENLQQVLSLINRKNPGNSDLLAILSQSHGGLLSPPLPPQSEEYASLTAWVFRTQSDSPFEIAESKVVMAGANQDVPSQLGVSVSPSNINGDFSSFSMTPEVDPRRPHDPNAFNQHFHGEVPQGEAISHSDPNAGMNPLSQGLPNGQMGLQPSSQSTRWPLLPVVNPKVVELPKPAPSFGPLPAPQNRLPLPENAELEKAVLSQTPLPPIGLRPVGQAVLPQAVLPGTINPGPLSPGTISPVPMALPMIKRSVSQGELKNAGFPATQGPATLRPATLRPALPRLQKTNDGRTTLHPANQSPK